MAPAINLNLCHLYPDLMDTYGDTGNIITLERRCALRNIKLNVKGVSLNDQLNANEFDIYFFGGGQDRNQYLVEKDLQTKKVQLKLAVKNNAVLLSICGGFQLLQNYFKTKDEKVIEGVGIFDAYTLGSNERMIQNLLISINPSLEQKIKNVYPAHFTHEAKRATQLIGFENHSGKTYLGKKAKPLGYVLSGSGNNGEDKTEGAIYKNAFGCYLHGSLLPKNPHFADYLISLAIERKQRGIKLKPLDDSIEWEAHYQSTKRTRSS